MPKSSRRQKQAGEKAKKGKEKPSKRSKSGKAQKSDERSPPAKIPSECGSDSEELEVIAPDLSNQCEIDEKLEENASKNNLSVFNVKSILHHVLFSKSNALSSSRSLVANTGEASSSCNDQTDSVQSVAISEEDRLLVNACIDYEKSQSQINLGGILQGANEGSHVLSDKRVVAMACKAAEDECKEDDVVLPEIEPKLTRSRFREVSQTTGATNPLELVKEAIIHSPLKNVVSPLKRKLKSPAKPVEVISEREEVVSENVPLAEISFSEGGSSDEEYVPVNDDWEGSEEDSESNLSNTSDLASPEPLRRTSRVKRKLLSDPVLSPPAKREKKPEANESVEEKNAIASPFKVPYPLSKKSREQKEKEDLIASRTRSRLPLTDTSLEGLEADFLLPDFSPDIYDLINLEELDSDDIYWQKWLSTLTSEKAPGDPEDTEDTEYNFMADDEREEKEEYRNDRAVQISQKELAELFEEFLSEIGDEINEVEVDNSKTPAAAEETTVSQEPDMTYEQRTCLIRQLQQHSQLLVQVHLLAREHTSLQEEAMVCVSLLNELIELSKSTANGGLLQSQPSRPSVFSYVGLSEAVRIVSLPFVSTDTFSNSPAVSPAPKPLLLASKRSSGAWDSLDKGLPIPRSVKDILRFSPIFIYTGLLPSSGFRPHDPPNRSAKFLQAEDNLLVLGIDQFGPDWGRIQKQYLPTKTEKQIKIRRKNLCSNRATDNVVKQFRDTGVIPNLPVSVNLKAMEDRHRVILPNAELVIETKGNVKKKRSGRKAKQTKTEGVFLRQPLPMLEMKPEIKEIVIVSNAERCEVVPNPIPLEKRSETSGINQILPTPPSQEYLSVLPCSIQENQASGRTPADCRSNAAIDDVGLSTNQDKEDAAEPILAPSVTSCDVTDVSEKETFETDQATVEPSDDVRDSLSATRTDNETHEDTQTRDRATAFAQSYLNNVKNCLKHDKSTYNAFLEVLLKSKCESWSPAKLYKEVASVLSNFPELVRDFVGFLEPHHAHEVGVFMTNNEILRARTFLKRLESHFQKNPSHFQKIIKAFTTYNFKEPKPTELYDAVVPLLKGQQYLVEEFNSFFGHFQPRLSDSDDFEEVELGSGSDIEVDDFEEVTIPDLAARTTKKNVMKGRNILTKPSCKPIRRPPFCGTTTRKGNKLKKHETGSKSSLEEEFDKSDKTDEHAKIDSGELTIDEINGDADDLKDNEELCEDMGDTYGKKGVDSDGEYSGYKVNKEDEECELSHRDLASPMKKSDSEHSSSPASECKFGTGDEFLDHNMESPGTTQGSHMTSTSESISDLSNEACDILPSSTVSSGRDDYEADVIRLRDSEGNGGMDEDTKRNIGNQGTLSGNGENDGPEGFVRNSTDRNEQRDNDGDASDEIQRISANNLELDEDGKPVIVWTRDEDKKILQLYQNRGFSESIFHVIAEELGNRTALQVKGRFRVLVSLLTNKDGESSSEESGSDAADEDGFE